MQLMNIWRRYKPVLLCVGVPSLAALMLLVLRIFATSTDSFGFMAWNLTLSLLACAAAFLFARSWRKRQKNWVILLFIIWLFLLPNTFYMLTDYVHVGESIDINILFDIVMVGLFVMAGFIQGCIALYLVHKPLVKKFGSFYAHVSMAIIILASSFAIDMGRFLRWNSWDILLNPRALLFDISDTILNPLNYNRSFLVTGVFFIAIGSVYIAFWQGTSYLRRAKSGKL